MPCKLLIKNIANNYSTGDIVLVVDSDHEFGKYESKAKFLAAGFAESDWPRQFVVVNVVDADRPDYDYLLDIDGGHRRYYIQPQGSDSPFYDQLLAYAEVTATKAILDSLIMDRLA